MTGIILDETIRLQLDTPLMGFNEPKASTGEDMGILASGMFSTYDVRKI